MNGCGTWVTRRGGLKPEVGSPDLFIILPERERECDVRAIIQIVEYSRLACLPPAGVDVEKISPKKWVSSDSA